MAGLIKKRLLKELAKFAKNLQPEQIELNTLKGEGELRDLTLDEDFLTAVLEFPIWLKLTKCSCNRVLAKIHWTHLGSKPLWLGFDRLEVYMTTCDDDGERVKRNLSGRSGKYGLTDRVIDGLHITVNSILIHFTSPGFVATFDISNLEVQSTTPNWSPARLDKTRVVEESQDMVTTFKKVTWQTFRLEFSSSEATHVDSRASPLRLITNQGSLLITIRKRLSDCSMQCGRLELVLDDYLLWIFTHSQVRQAILFVGSLIDIIRRAEASQSASMAAAAGLVPAVASVVAAAQKSKIQTPPVQKKASKKHLMDPSASWPDWSVLETSFHIRLANVSLQLYDDSAKERSSDEHCGSMQFSISGFMASYHPRHPMKEPRDSGARAFVQNRHMDARNDWATKVLRSQQQLKDGVQVGAACERFSWSAMLERSFTFGCSDMSCQFFPSATSKSTQQPFLVSKKEHIPDDPPTFMLNYTSYRYIDDVPFKVPASNLFVSVYPVQFTFEAITCLWTTEFVKMISDTIAELDLRERGQPTDPERKAKVKKLTDIYFSILLPTVTLPISIDGKRSVLQSNTTALEVQGANVVFTNCGSDDKGQGALPEFVVKLNDIKIKSREGFSEAFPSKKEDLYSLPDIRKGEVTSAWLCKIDQLWGQFLPKPTKTDPSPRPVQFLAAVPINSWIVFPTKVCDGLADIHVMSEISSTALVRLNHDELIAVFSLRDILVKFMADLAVILARRATKRDKADKSITISASGTLQDLFLLLALPDSKPTKHDEEDGRLSIRQVTDSESASLVSEQEATSRPKQASQFSEEQSSDSGFITTSHESRDLDDRGAPVVSLAVVPPGDVISSARSSPSSRSRGSLLSLASSTSTSTILDENAGTAAMEATVVEASPSPLSATKGNECDGFDIITEEEIQSYPLPGQTTEFSSLDFTLRTTSGIVVDRQRAQSDAGTGGGSGNVVRVPVGGSSLPMESIRELKIDGRASSAPLPDTTPTASSFSPPPFSRTSVDPEADSGSPVVEVGLFNGRFNFQLTEPAAIFKLTAEGCSVAEKTLTAKEADDLERKRKQVDRQKMKEKERMEKVALRFSSERTKVPGEPSESQAVVTVSNLSATLQLSTALALKDFANDDLIPPSNPLPIHLSLDDCLIRLPNEEADEALELKYKEVGLEFVPKPLALRLDGLRITRGRDNVISIGPNPCSSSSSEPSPDPEAASEAAQREISPRDDTASQTNPVESATELMLMEMKKHNSVLEDSLEYMSKEKHCLERTVEGAQLGKEELLKSMRDLNTTVETLKEEKRRLEIELASLKSLLLAQEKADEDAQRNKKS